MNRARLRTILILVSVAVLARACVFRPATSNPGASFNQGANAVWVDVTWVKDRHDEREIATLANTLAQRQIRHAFVYVSYLKPTGAFNPTDTYAAEFVRAFKAAQPQIDLQAWIGLPTNQPNLGGSQGYVDLANAATRDTIAHYCAVLVQQVGFDGIHLDPEAVQNENTDLVRLLGQVRRELGPTPKLSVATHRIQPVFPDLVPPFFGRVFWSAHYYQEVAQQVDQVALMTYDSTVPVPSLYRLWTRFETIQISRALDGTNVSVFVGIPTSEEETRTHHAGAENMLSGLEGVIDGLNDAEARPAVITGVAIYPDWETDESEWATYQQLWLGK